MVKKSMLLLSTILIFGCASAPPKGMGPVELVESVDKERYLGRWYEIARSQGFDTEALYRVPQKPRK